MVLEVHKSIRDMRVTKTSPLYGLDELALLWHRAHLTHFVYHEECPRSQAEVKISTEND